MKKKDWKGGKLASVGTFLGGFALFGLTAAIALQGFQNVGEASDSEGRKLLEQNLTRAVVSCYATEGIYPPDIEYLERHYGIAVSRDKYLIHYDIFASNLMPYISVVDLAEP